MKIELNNDARTAAIASIQRYVCEHLEIPIGNVQAGGLLQFFLEEIGPSVYNRAVGHIQERLQTRISELDIECHEEEFTYWTRRRAR